MNILCLKMEQETNGHKVKQTCIKFLQQFEEIESALCKESFLHWRESRLKLFHFKTIESSLSSTFTSIHYASAELFLWKINPIKVSFRRGALY